jgi:HD-GYP domain-containing protein (c-di-GMP phosphodiesterase class II)
MNGNVYASFGLRIGLAAVVISAVLGASTYAYQQHALTREVIRMAAAEARGFVAVLGGDLRQLMAGPNLEVDTRLDEYLVSNEVNENGHFILAELYNAAQVSLAEATRPKAEEIEPLLDRTRHQFPADDEPVYDKVAADGGLYMRVVVPLTAADQGRLGYFEGVYQLSEKRRQQMRSAALLTVATVIGVVLATTLFLVPIIITLNRNLLGLSRKLLKANIQTLDLLGGAVAKRDSDTDTHNYRVTLYAIALAEAVGLPRGTMQELIKGSFLHDVGKIAITDAILLKPGRLTPDEFTVMKTHVDHGIDIIARSPWLMTAAADVVRYHHEKYDGSGYNTGLAGEAIPIIARIFAIADVFDALTSKRPYKEPMPFDKAMAILQESSGSHFDPTLVTTFAGIAQPLFQAYGNREDGSVEAALDRRTAEYFGV